jgi:hypothetical protein
MAIKYLELAAINQKVVVDEFEGRLYRSNNCPNYVQKLHSSRMQ